MHTKQKLKNGEIFEGTLEAADRFALSRELKSRGNIPISIMEKEVNLLTFQVCGDIFFSKIKNEELIIFTKNLSGMLQAGLSLYRALSVLKNKQKSCSR